MKLAIVGTGYVGLVTGTCLAETGNDVTCVDCDVRKIEKLLHGEVPIYEPGLAELISRNVAAGLLHFSTDLAAAAGQAKVIFLNSWLQPENGHADVFLPISVQTERSGHYTNFRGEVSAFAACFGKKPGVIDAQALFAALAAPVPAVSP